MSFYVRIVAGLWFSNVIAAAQRDSGSDGLFIAIPAGTMNAISVLLSYIEDL